MRPSKQQRALQEPCVGVTSAQRFHEVQMALRLQQGLRMPLALMQCLRLRLRRERHPFEFVHRHPFRQRCLGLRQSPTRVCERVASRSRHHRQGPKTPLAPRQEPTRLVQREACRRELQAPLAVHTQAQPELAPLERVYWFNHDRLPEPIGYGPPSEAEANYYRQPASQDIAV